jgi:hypothetical protein
VRTRVHNPDDKAPNAVRLRSVDTLDHVAFALIVVIVLEHALALQPAVANMHACTGSAHHEHCHDKGAEDEQFGIGHCSQLLCNMQCEACTLLAHHEHCTVHLDKLAAFMATHPGGPAMTMCRGGRDIVAACMQPRLPRPSAGLDHDHSITLHSNTCARSLCACLRVSETRFESAVR